MNKELILTDAEEAVVTEVVKNVGAKNALELLNSRLNGLIDPDTGLNVQKMAISVAIIASNSGQDLDLFTSAIMAEVRKHAAISWQEDYSYIMWMIRNNTEKLIADEDSVAKYYEKVSSADDKYQIIESARMLYRLLNIHLVNCPTDEIRTVEKYRNTIFSTPAISSLIDSALVLAKEYLKSNGGYSEDVSEEPEATLNEESTVANTETSEVVQVTTVAPSNAITKITREGRELDLTDLIHTILAQPDITTNEKASELLAALVSNNMAVLTIRGVGNCIYDVAWKRYFYAGNRNSTVNFVGLKNTIALNISDSINTSIVDTEAKVDDSADIKLFYDIINKHSNSTLLEYILASKFNIEMEEWGRLPILGHVYYDGELFYDHTGSAIDFATDERIKH